MKKMVKSSISAHILCMCTLGRMYSRQEFVCCWIEPVGRRNCAAAVLANHGRGSMHAWMNAAERCEFWAWDEISVLTFYANKILP